MTQTVARKCSWSRGRASKKVPGDLSLTLMAKAQSLSRVYSSSFVPDYRLAVEAVDESEGLVSPGQVGSEDSYAPRRRCMSLNADRCGGFLIPMQVIPLSNMSSLEKKDLEMRLRRELELVQKLQKKILPRTTSMSNGAAVSSYCNPLATADPLVTGQNDNQLKRGVTGRFESMKHVPAPTSFAALMKQCETLLKCLLGHQYAWVFNKPVDAVKLNIPDYFSVIKQPMDLGTIQSNLASGCYTSPMDFASHVRLTFSNALTYNPPGNDVHIMANIMSKFFEMRWKPIEKKLAAVTKRESGVTMPAPQSKKRKIPQEDPTIVVLDCKLKMTDGEKWSLSRRLSLIPELPQHIVDFLKRHTGNADQNIEEIEIDFDALGVEALFELKNLLDEYSKQKHSEQQEKTEPCEIEILNESGLSNSSSHPCKGNNVDEDEDVDIGGNDHPTKSYFALEGVNCAVTRSSRGSSSSSSSSESGSASSDTDSGSISRSRSNSKRSGFPNMAKENGPQIASSAGKGLVNGMQPEQGGHLKRESVEPNGSQEEENAPSEKQVSPDKLYRAALLRSRFADTILKAREKTLDQGEKKDPEKLRREREELERQQRVERMRLQAEAKAAEDARKLAEKESAAKAKRNRELQREAARQALLQMEKTVEINEGSLFLKDLEMLRNAPAKHIPCSNEGIPDCCNEGMDDFKLGGSNPLEQLGLYMKVDDDDDEGEYCDGGQSRKPDAEGEID